MEQTYEANPDSSQRNADNPYDFKGVEVSYFIYF